MLKYIKISSGNVCTSIPSPFSYCCIIHGWTPLRLYLSNYCFGSKAIFKAFRGVSTYLKQTYQAFSLFVGSGMQHPQLDWSLTRVMFCRSHCETLYIFNEVRTYAKIPNTPRNCQTQPYPNVCILWHVAPVFKNKRNNLLSGTGVQSSVTSEYCTLCFITYRLLMWQQLLRHRSGICPDPLSSYH